MTDSFSEPDAEQPPVEQAVERAAALDDYLGGFADSVHPDDTPSDSVPGAGSIEEVWRGPELQRALTLRHRIATAPHSPNEFRANQTVRNVPAFYEAFGVEETDGLWLPEAERVSIW